MKIIGAQTYSIRHSATAELAKQESVTQLGNQQVIQAKILKGQSKIYILTLGELETMREFLRELKGRTSRMMLKVDWSAWNDIDEIRSLFCRSMISLTQRIIDKEMLSTSYIDEYEEEIDE
ncbi:MAG: hypothetical protein EZS28_023954 [Streblomastix strix]|uniref:Uncharacterized protein n=1 Tax=Streblomastix strix TaxID=222440 RepID=A0A5J4VDA1_9EUKA|nr:MAG: hypothetical protein EZS28_023954 [Streblomastix strix]